MSHQIRLPASRRWNTSTENDTRARLAAPACIISVEMKWTRVDARESRCDRGRMTSGALLVARLHVDLRRQASAVCSASR
ncbi:putative leader peptide [Catenulispora pinistramenti]|uniref:putative leader peptide n=1 Tax=Catenulispora pinistramenti TaxID=2705254 RepID=UPI0039B6C1E2